MTPSVASTTGQRQWPATWHGFASNLEDDPPPRLTSRWMEPKLSILTLRASSWKALWRDHSGGLRVSTSWPTKVMFICRPLIWIISASAATGPTLFCVGWQKGHPHKRTFPLETDLFRRLSRSWLLLWLNSWFFLLMERGRSQSFLVSTIYVL